MSTKLTNITNQYSKFSDNQVLTKAQLNQFLDYFDDQDRLSRIGLNGVGIVCGFKITWIKPTVSTASVNIRTTIDEVESIPFNSGKIPEEALRLNGNTVDQYIEISRGTAVTTDGDLLKFTEALPNNDEAYRKLLAVDKKKFTHYKVYNNTEAPYAPFDNNPSLIAHLELVEASEALIDDSYAPLSEIELTDKVVFLYLESYTKQGDLCTTLDCDSQGQAQIRKLKVLLLDSEVAQRIAAVDVIYNKHHWYKFLSAIKPLKAKRDVIRFSNAQLTDLEEIKTIYFKLISNITFKNELILGINTILKQFGEIELPASFFNNLWPINSSNLGSDFQYRYDVLKDVVASYTEIRELLLKINVECCPSINAFPKHIMLGYVNDKVADFELRHRFYSSPIAGEQQAFLAEATTLITRLSVQLANYRMLSSDAEIKITPSKTQVVLGNKAIPAYYQTTNTTLISNWNHQLTAQFAANSNIGYYNNFIPSTNNTIDNTSLDYCFEEFDFLRIEGIQGKVYTQALARLQDLKQEYGLNFDIKVLRLTTEDTTININDFDCEFRDLRILLQAWQSEQSCALQAASELLSGFSTDDAGVNVSSSGNVSATTANDGPTSSNGSDTMVSNASQGDYQQAVDVLAQAGLLEGKAVRQPNRAEEIVSEDKIYKAYIFLQESLGKERLLKLGVPSENELKAQFQLKSAASFGKGVFNGINSPAKAPFKTPQQQVQDSLVTSAGTLGKILKEVIKENPEAKAAAIISAVNNELTPIFNSEAWASETETREIIELSVAVLANIYDYTTIVPDSLIALDSDNLSKTNASLEEICDLIDTLKEKYEGANLSDSLQNDISILINQLSGVCCSGEKLALLIAEIDERKGKVLESTIFRNFVTKHPGIRHRAGVPMGGTFVMVYQSESTFDEDIIKPITLKIPFANQPRNGSKAQLKFVSPRLSSSITFLGKAASTIDKALVNGRTTAESEEMLLGNITRNRAKKVVNAATLDKSIDGGSGKGIANFLFEEVINIQKSLEETVAEIVKLWNKNWARANALNNFRAKRVGTEIHIEVKDYALQKNANYFQVSNATILKAKSDTIVFEANRVIPANPTPSNTVVADFALPYMCCSDCAPVNYVLPRETVSLKVDPSKNQICLGTSEASSIINFDVIQPSDGTVRALVPTNINSGLIKNEDNLFQFDPTQVDPSLYGRPIRFTVNEESTSASITVYEELVVSVLENPNIEYNANKTLAFVTFELQGNYDEDTKFAWDFFGNNSEENDSPTNGTLRVTYNLPPAVDAENPNRVKPSLNVFNGPCVYPVSINEIIFDEPIPKASISIGSVPCIDRNDTDEESVSIPIIEVQPPNASLELRTIGKELPVGLHITNDNNEIVINKNLFGYFGTDLYFWVNGNRLDVPVLEIIDKNHIANFSAQRYQFNIEPGNPVSVQLSVDNLSPKEKTSGDYHFNWDFGNGDTSDAIFEGQTAYDIIYEYNTKKLGLGTHTFEIELTVKGGRCKQATQSQTITIKVAEKTKPTDCIGNVQKEIQEIADTLDREEAISSESFEAIGKVVTIYKLLDQRKNEKYRLFFTGEFNSTDTSDPNTESVKSLFNDLSSELKDLILKASNEEERSILDKYYLALIRAFFLIFKCQDARKFREIEDFREVFENIKTQLDELLVNEVVFLEEEAYKTFFENYLKYEKLSEAFKQLITDEILVFFKEN